MEFFSLIPDKCISNPPKITRLNPQIYSDEAKYSGFSRAPQMAVAYFENSPEIEKPDVLYSPVFLISDRLKNLFKCYVPDMPFKGVQCYPENMEDNESYLYWWPYIEEEPCLSVSTEKYPNGMLKKLVLDSGCLEGKHIFRVAGTIESILIVSLELAESMLRRQMWGMKLETVHIARGIWSDEEEIRYD